MDPAREAPQINIKPIPRRRLWIPLTLGLIAAFAILIAAGEVVLHRGAPLIKARVLETLRARFNGRVELDGLNASLLRGIEVSGSGLRIFPPDETVAAGDPHPLISIDRFSFRAGIVSLFERPMRVGSVHVNGLTIYIPPKDLRRPELKKSDKPSNGKIEIAVDEIVCDSSHLIIGTSNQDKEPKDFELQHIELHNLSAGGASRYEATLTNAVPRGEIHASGRFGPWVTESPGDSSISGDYTFDRADLAAIRGIGGTLSSTGQFTGQLNRIAVSGETRTPDFLLDTGNHPMPLTTRFQAVVDGLNGNTYLNSVAAQLAGTQFTTQGSVVNLKGVGHTIDLEVNVPAGRIQDFLVLAAKTQPAVMTGVLSTQTRLHIAPGKERVIEKLQLRGDLRLTQVHFTNPKVEDKVDMLSLRAQGDPQDAKPGAKDVTSAMTGRYTLNAGKIAISKLVYKIPGAHIDLDGVYTLDGKQFDFHGTVFTQARISKMVSSPWKSFLLKAVDPFFRGEDGGSAIPVQIHGTQSEPKFGLDLHKDEPK